MMANVVFTCPATRMKVQHWSDADPDVPETEYEVVVCKACTGPHLINRKTGRLLGRRTSDWSARPKRRARIALHDSRKAAGAGLAQGTPDTGRLLKTKPRSPQHSPAGSTALQWLVSRGLWGDFQPTSPRGRHSLCIGGWCGRRR